MNRNKSLIHIFHFVIGGFFFQIITVISSDQRVHFDNVEKFVISNNRSLLEEIFPSFNRGELIRANKQIDAILHTHLCCGLSSMPVASNKKKVL